MSIARPFAVCLRTDSTVQGVAVGDTFIQHQGKPTPGLLVAWQADQAADGDLLAAIPLSNLLSVDTFEEVNELPDDTELLEALKKARDLAASPVAATPEELAELDAIIAEAEGEEEPEAEGEEQGEEAEEESEEESKEETPA